MTMRTTARLLVAFCLFAFTFTAFAGDLSKKERKALEAEWAAVYSGPVWALAYLPVKTGVTMGIPWIGPTTTVRTDGYTIDATQAA